MLWLKGNLRFCLELLDTAAGVGGTEPSTQRGWVSTVGDMSPQWSVHLFNKCLHAYCTQSPALALEEHNASRNECPPCCQGVITGGRTGAESLHQRESVKCPNRGTERVLWEFTEDRRRQLNWALKE